MGNSGIHEIAGTLTNISLYIIRRKGHKNELNDHQRENASIFIKSSYRADTQTRTLGRRLSIHNFYFKWTNNFPQFESYFLRDQESSNSFTVFNSCIVEP